MIEKIVKIECQGAGKIPLSEIRDFQGDLKVLSEASYMKLKNQISENGFSFPFAVWAHDGKYFTIDGHQRKKVLLRMQEEGWALPEVFPVDFVEAKNKAQAKKKLLSAVSQYGRLTDEGLFDFLRESDLDAQCLENLILPEIDLKNFLKKLEEKNRKQYSEEELEDVPEDRETNIQYGDMFQLGDHRLLCGDSTKAEDVGRLMGEEKADMVFTDPPYNVDYEGYTDKKLKIKNDKMSDEEFILFLENVFKNYTLFINKKASAYICHPTLYQREFQNCLEKTGFSIRNTIIWAKNTFAWGFGRYKYQHEPIFYCYLNGNSDNWYGDKTQSTLWQIKKPASNKLYPTMKPIELINIALINSSKNNDVVLDLFGGSGSTLIACENLQRKCRMMELDPVYCQVIIDRWEKLTDKKAVKI